LFFADISIEWVAETRKGVFPMTHELILTSVAQGLDPGDHGFCPVAASAGISPRIVQCLASLNSYRRLTAQSGGSHVAYSHLIFPGGLEHVLSRVADAGTDYRGQPNIFAHHIVLEGMECCTEGPGWLLALPGFHFSAWNDPPVRFAHGRSIPTLTNPPSLTRRQQIARQSRWLDPQKIALTGSVDTASEDYLATVRSNEDQISLSAPPTSPCPAWQKLSGDPGWAGVLAETAFTEQPIVLIYKPGQNILPLFLEALALLPPRSSWRVTFCTYFTGIPGTMPCQWKGVVAGSREAKILAKDSNNMVLDLTVSLGDAFAGKYVDYARLGQEYLLPLDAEEYAAANADTKSFGDEAKAGTDRMGHSSGTPMDKASDPALAVIQLPKKPPGLLESFLHRSSRFQFYLLYGIMFALVLFLLVLAVDQVGEFGIVQKLRQWNLPPVSEPHEEPEPEHEHDVVSPLDEVGEPEPEKADLVVQEDTRKKVFDENREEQKIPLLQFLESFNFPEYLAIQFPDVHDGRIDVPEKQCFEELASLHPFGAALELQFIPLFELPDMLIETRQQPDALPNLVWLTCAIDTETRLETPMFLFQLTEFGLDMHWQPVGLSNQNLYNTVLSSLGFLEFRVADTPSSAIEIPLFEPIKAEPVKVAELMKLAVSVTPEHVVELPFASELWQSVFADMNPPLSLRLEVRVEPPGDWAQTNPSPVSEFSAEVLTSQQAGKLTENGETVFESVGIQFAADVALEKVVWKGDKYAERLRVERTHIKSTKDGWEKKKEQLQGKIFSGGILNDAEKREFEECDVKQRELKFRLDEIENILGKLPEAYKEIGENNVWCFCYSVFLESREGTRRLLVLTTE
jgi:hypothetical protein